MELKDFIQKAVVDIIQAIDQSREDSIRNVYLTSSGSNRTIEFDIAASVESSDTKGGKAGIKVLEFVEGGGKIEKTNRNSTVTRIKFGVNVSVNTKKEEVDNTAETKREIAATRANRLAEGMM